MASLLSLSPHGESGLKFHAALEYALKNDRLSPHGESGLKFENRTHVQYNKRSLSTRREWIEIQHITYLQIFYTGLSPHGESGLKLRYPAFYELVLRLSPHGESGLK